MTNEEKVVAFFNEARDVATKHGVEDLEVKLLVKSATEVEWLITGRIQLPKEKVVEAARVQ